MTIEQLNRVEEDLRSFEREFPRDYGAVKALELAAELRRLITREVVDQHEGPLLAAAERT